MESIADGGGGRDLEDKYEEVDALKADEADRIPVASHEADAETSQSSESSSDSDSDEEDETKKTEPAIIPDNFVPENLMESTTDGKGPKDIQVEEEVPKILEASISSDQPPKDRQSPKPESKADSEELPTPEIDSPKPGADSASKPAVAEVRKDSTDVNSPRQLSGKDSDGELITMADNGADETTVVHQGSIPPPAGKIKKRKSFNCTVLQKNDDLAEANKKRSAEPEQNPKTNKKISKPSAPAKKKKEEVKDKTAKESKSRPTPSTKLPSSTKLQVACSPIGDVDADHESKEAASSMAELKSDDTGCISSEALHTSADLEKIDDQAEADKKVSAKKTEKKPRKPKVPKESAPAKKKKEEVQKKTKPPPASAKSLVSSDDNNDQEMMEAASSGGDLKCEDISACTLSEGLHTSPESQKKEEMAKAAKKCPAKAPEKKPKSHKKKVSKPDAPAKKKKEEVKEKTRESRPVRSTKSLVSTSFGDVDDDQESKDAASSRADFNCEDGTAWTTAEEMDASGGLEFVIAKSLTGEYITKRKGMDYTQLDYEEGPPEKKAKGSQEDDGDISLAISHYEARLSAFKKDLKLRTVDGKLDLDDLRSGSPLEMLAFLGNMREDVFLPPSTRLPPPDVWMKVPMLGLCHLMQTLLDGERAGKATLIKRLAACQQRLQNLQAKRASQD